MRIELLTFCFLSVLSLSSVYGQNEINYKFGLIGGVSAAQISTPSLKTISGLLWYYTTGVGLQQRFSQRLALVYELKYIRQGAKAKVSGIMGNDVIVTEHDYVTLPILVQFQPKNEPVFVQLGGQSGYFLAGRSYFASGKDQASQAQNMTKLDAGLTAGVGYRLGRHGVLDARYYYGMRRIHEDFEIDDPTTGMPTLIRLVPQYNRAWSLNLSYYF